MLTRLQSGMCKINTKRRKEKESEYYCTLERELLPKRGSDFHKNIIKENIENEEYLIAWSLNKNKGKGLDPEAGWVKIPTSEIIGWKFIGKR